MCSWGNCVLNVCVYVCVRYKESHVVTARAAVTVIHPELGCLIGSLELQKFSIILLYAEEGSSPGQQKTTLKPLLFICLGLPWPAVAGCSLLLLCPLTVPVSLTVGSVKARKDSPGLQRCFFQLSALGMDPVILLGGILSIQHPIPFSLHTTHGPAGDRAPHTDHLPLRDPGRSSVSGFCGPGL